MTPLVLASQSQALPLLFLPLAMATSHPDTAMKRTHASSHTLTAVSAPVLYPANATSCNPGGDSVGTPVGQGYVFVIDSRFGLNVSGSLRKARTFTAAM